MLRPIATSKSNYDGWVNGLWEDLLHFLSLIWFRYLLTMIVLYI